MQTLIVFSHLRWDFVYQRPQHLLSRLAPHYRVLFFEEPLRGNRTPFLERLSPCPNIEVLRPHTTVDAPGFHDDQLPELKLLLAEYLQDFSIDDYLVWFYTPMALPLLSDLQPRAVVYDCMDQLSAFKGAPRQMLQRETGLMRCADLVLTGGPSLYEAKRKMHANVHCFPSAVDADHFMPPQRRRDIATASPDSGGSRMCDSSKPAAQHSLARDAARLHEVIGRPRLGFFGVIDERFDIELISALADRAPDWEWVMVGPVVKIDPACLPKKPNIHWLGQQSYDVLPHLVSHWDVCLLPFALNESTRFISPTKTLEYMAAEKPIVSTPIRDVASLYGDCVAIASSPAEFVAACVAALAETDANRSLRIERMREHVIEGSWDRTARSVRTLIAKALQRRGAGHLTRPPVWRPATAVGVTAARSERPVAAAKSSASAGT